MVWLKEFVVLKEFWLLVSVRDIFQYAPLWMLLKVEGWVTGGW